jgi:hypothetical protein
LAQRLVGGATALIGLGLLVPAIVAWREQGDMPLLGVAVLVPGALLMACGAGAAALGGLRTRGRPIPASVLAALIVNAVFLALFALEISTGLARQGGVVAKSLFFFPPGVLLFWGLLGGRRWAWHLGRWSSLAFALLFLGVACAVCAFRPTDAHGPVWVWIACVSAVLGSVLFVGGFCALGRSSARRYFCQVHPWGIPSCTHPR